MITVIDRGADILADAGRIDSDLASELKAEARRRVEAGTFFGHIAYASVIARKTLRAGAAALSGTEVRRRTTTLLRR